MSIIGQVAERVAPRVLWRYRARKWLGADHSNEKELVLLPHLCQADQMSVDVGASLGLFVIHLLGHSSQVLAFEPRPSAAAELKRMFRGSAARIEQFAVSDQETVEEFRIAVDDPGRSTLDHNNPLEHVGAVETVRVETRRLDGFNLTNVGFIKIDVEGHELAALKGAQETLRKCRPALLIEIEERHHPGSLAGVRALLEPLGYSCWFLLNQKLAPLSQADAHVYNFIFLQPEQRARLTAAGF